MTPRQSRFSLEDHEDRLVWIFGSSRSGSTWLLRMLSELDGVVPVDDPHLGHHLGVWRPIPLAWAACDDPPDLTTLLDVKADKPGYFFNDRHRESWWQPLRALIQARFEAQAQELDGLSAPRSVVVKEPGSHVAPLLADLFPSSKLIFLLRDGRDVVDSWLDAYQQGTWAIPQGAFPVSPRGRIPLIRWLSAVWAYRSRAVQQALDSRSPQGYAVIRYEELRARTSEVLGEICEKFGLGSEELGRGGEDLAEIAARHEFERLPGGIRGSRREIRLATPGAWRENLSRAEQDAMHEALGAALEEFGYSGEPAPRATAAV
jgi:hypothetical protein